MNVVGSTIGGYRLERLLGSGGMGHVFAARQAGLEREVAVKVLHADRAGDPTEIERFRREAQVMSRVQHPNVVRIFDCGVEGQLWWVSMELVDGVTLKQHGQARIPALEAVTIARDLCRGLAAVHEVGLIHRDIKPVNVMLTPDGTVKLMDFGLAKDPNATSLTEAGELAGTPAYLAPEAVVLGGRYDHRGDIYQVGLVLYKLLTGRLPHDADTLPAYLELISSRPGPPPSVHTPGLAPRLDELVAAAIHPDPARRPTSAREMAEALDKTLVEASLAGVRRPSLAKKKPSAATKRGSRQTATPRAPAATRLTGRLLVGLTLAALVVAAIAGSRALLSPPADPVVRELAVVPGLRRASVTFALDGEAAPRVVLTPATERQRIQAVPESPGRHRVTITGLEPGKEHRIDVLVDDRIRASKSFATKTVLVENLRKRVGLDSLEVDWTTSLPVHSSLVWKAPGESECALDVPESPSTSHTARITGLHPDHDYDLTIVSHLDDREVQNHGPIELKLFRSAAQQFLAEFDRSSFEQRMAALLRELRHKENSPARLTALLRTQLEPMQRSAELLKPICREFFSSRSVYVSIKVKVYQSLKHLESLECAAAGLALPLPRVLGGVDWGTFYQRPRPFAAGPDVRIERRELPSTDPAEPGKGSHVEEWREADDERGMLSVVGMVRETQEIALHFPVRDAARVREAELAVVHLPTLSKIGRYRARLHYIELEVNGRVGLVVRIPVLDPRPDQPTTDHAGFDPALLVEGDNVVRVRVKSCPPLRGEGARFVRSVELRTRSTSAGP